MGKNRNILRRDILAAAYEAVHSQADKMFEAEYSGTVGRYNAANFNRYAFDTRDEVDSFVKYMSDNGVSSCQLPEAFEGKYVVEIPKYCDRNQIQDENYLNRENRRSTGDVDTASLVYNYQEVSDTYVNRFQPQERAVNDVLYPTERMARRDESYNSQLNNVLIGKYVSQLEGLNSIYSATRTAIGTYREIRDISHELKGYVDDLVSDVSEKVEFVSNIAHDGVGTIDKQNNAIFTSGDVERNDYQSNAHVRIVGMKANGMPDYAVYMNGKLYAEGSDEYNNIMDLYNQRMDKAREIVDNGGVTDEFKVAFGREARVENAQKVLDKAYNQTFSLNGKQAWYDVNDAALLASAINVEREINGRNYIRHFDNVNTFSAEDKSIISKLESEKKLSTSGADALAKGLSSSGGFEMSIDEREEAIRELKSISNGMFSMSTGEEAGLRSFMNTANSSGLGYSGLSFNPLGEEDWQNVSSAIKRYSKNLSSPDRQLVQDFLDNRQLLATNLKEYESVSIKMRNETDASVLTSLQDRKNQLEKEAFSLRQKVDEDRLESIMKNALGDSSANALYQGRIDDLVKKLNFTDAENDIRAANLHLLESFKELDMKTAGILGSSYQLINFENGADLEKLSEISARLQKAALEKGIPIFTLSGKLDVSALKSLSPKDRKTLGLDDKTIEAIILLNSKRAFNKPKDYRNALQEMLHKKAEKIKRAGRMISSIRRNMRGAIQKAVGNDEDIGALLSNIHKGYKVASGHHIKMVTAKIRKIQRLMGKGEVTMIKTESISLKAKRAAKTKMKSSESYQKFAQKMAGRRIKRLDARTERLGKKFGDADKLRKRTKAVKSAGKSASKLAGAGAKKAVAGKAAGQAAGAAAKAVGTGASSEVWATVLAVLAVLIGAIIIIIIIMTTIQSFLNRDPIGDALAPKTTADTVAFKLYEQLSEQEMAWVSELRDFDYIYKYREGLRYTERYLDWVDYTQNVKQFTLDYKFNGEGEEDAANHNTYINPFWRLPYTDTGEYLSQDYRTKVDDFDGSNKATIGTNESVFTQTGALEMSKYSNKGSMEDLIAEGMVYSVGYNTGHTSNIKDILAMTDVMYSMEIDGAYNSDNGLGDDDAGIMGQSPAKLDWDNFKDEKLGRIRQAWQSLKNWALNKLGISTEEFNEDNPLNKYTYKELKIGGKKSFSTVSNYAITLFHASHQQQLYLDVEYFNGDGQIQKGLSVKTTDTSGNEVEHKLSQKEASKLGICVNPVNKTFYIAVDKMGAPIAAIRGNDADSNEYENFDCDKAGVIGEGYQPVGTKNDFNGMAWNHDVQLDLEKNLENRNVIDPDLEEGHLCFDKSYKGDKATYEKILAQIDGSAGSGDNGSCWSLYETEDDYYTPAQQYYETPTQGYKDTKYVRSEREYPDNEMPINNEADAKEYIGNVLLWGSEFYHVYDPNGWNWCGLYGDLGAGYCPDKLDYFERKLIEKLENKDVNGGTKFEKAEDGCWYKYELNDKKNTFTVTKVETLPQAIRNAGLSRKGDTIIDDIDNNLSDWVVEKKTSSGGVYRKYKLTKQTKTVYHRNCTGHTFAYCGGHLAIHNHGSVYSATDDEIAVAGIVDEDIDPSADEFDVYEAFDGELKGKYNEENFPTEEELEAEYGDGDLPRLPAANVMAQSGKGDSPWEDIYQGSYAGSQGLNLYMEGEQWGDGIDTSAFVTVKGEIEIPSRASLFMRDIFDVDCTLKYGKDVFPTYADPANYHSWTTDNMQFALNRISMDWSSLYGFDIPYEIGDLFEPEMTTEKDKSGQDVQVAKEDDEGHLIKGNANARGYALSEDDIEAIIDGVKANSSINEDREEAIRTALRWVGRGYDEGNGIVSQTGKPHDASNFNQRTVGGYVNVDNRDESVDEMETVFYRASSTMSYSEAFVDYLRWQRGDVVPLTDSGAGTRKLSSKESLKPADYIVHRGNTSPIINGEWKLPTDIGSSNLDKKDFSMKQMYMLQDFYSETQVAIYIGKLNENLTLSTGQTLYANTMLIVDMNAQMDYVSKHFDNKGEKFKNGLTGQISIHGQNPENFWQDWDYKYVYWWLANPIASRRDDIRTEYYSFK